MTRPPQYNDKQLVREGKHLNLVARGPWEYVERPKITGIVSILAITPENRMILIEQYRPPLDAYSIEVPAGLAGDIVGQENEDLANAARRELEEETGYTAERFVLLNKASASGGICNEVISMYRAENVRKTSAGGGDGSENITVHEIPLGEVGAWLVEQTRAGKIVNWKVYGALYFAGAGALPIVLP